MTFAQYEKNKDKIKKNEKKARSDRFKQVNSHINFSKESSKTNARKDETDVTCVQCQSKFTLPFRPRNPEVYCDNCFKNKKKSKKFR